ncbi:hypothetical protein BCD48_27910 [Pseudofrankia sp. BMG5.36]|nr:hypothetical protein BCD48_27910 [Pseudofrankia sp. BMG5.36]
MPRDVILRATIDLIAENGVASLSVDAVAASAGVSKLTIYRHWGSRAGLIHAAFSCVQRPSVEPDTGSLRDDLIQLLWQLVSYLNRQDISRAFPSFVEAANRDPELDALRRKTEREARSTFERVILRGIERGELVDDLDVRLFVDFVMAPFIYQRVIEQSKVRSEDIATLVDVALSGFNRPPTKERWNGKYDPAARNSSTEP